MDIKASLTSSIDQASAAKVDGLVERGSREGDIKKVKQLAKDFESIFLEQMFKSMRSSVQKSGLIDGGNAEEIYTSMLDSEYAKQMSQQSASGLADMIERQLLQSMGVKSGSSPSALKKAAVHSYERAGAATLRPEQKEVTIGTGVASATKIRG
jgi:flagellar protein FlgJ